MRLKTSLLALGFVVLSACGGGANPAQAPAPVQGGNKIFIGDDGNGVLAVVDTLTPKPGALTAKICSSPTEIWSDAAFDGPRDELYVATVSSST